MTPEVKEILEEIKKRYEMKSDALKLSPYEDNVHLESALDVLADLEDWLEDRFKNNHDLSDAIRKGYISFINTNEQETHNSPSSDLSDKESDVGTQLEALGVRLEIAEVHISRLNTEIEHLRRLLIRESHGIPQDLAGQPIKYL